MCFSIFLLVFFLLFLHFSLPSVFVLLIVFLVFLLYFLGFLVFLFFCERKTYDNHHHNRPPHPHLNCLKVGADCPRHHLRIQHAQKPSLAYHIHPCKSMGERWPQAPGQRCNLCMIEHYMVGPHMFLKYF